MNIKIGTVFTIKSLNNIELNGCEVKEGDTATLIDVLINDYTYPFRIKFQSGNDEYFSLEEVQIMAGII